MNTYLYNPWRWIDQVQRDLAAVVEPQRARATAWAPDVDVQDYADRFVIRLDVPGVDPQKIDVKTEDGVLTITGARDSEASDDAKYLRRERVSGNFTVRFSLPDRIDADRITAQNRHGVLSVVIPKSAATQPRKIAIEH